MAKHQNPNLAKIHRNYTVEEVAKLFSVHKNTVRMWIKDGLATVDQKRPLLIRGSSLREYLQDKRIASKHKCQSYEIYCLRCRLPKRPAENMVDYEIINATTGRLIGLCPCCNNIINKYFRIDQLVHIQGKLDFTLPKALKHINESSNPL